MPWLAILAAVDVALLAHAAKTDRFNPWGYIILMVPGVGAAVYVAFEVLPEYFGTHEGAKVRRSLEKKLSPDRDYHARRDDFANASTVANRMALAAECMATRRFDEALLHYRVLKATDHASEPMFWIGAAKALQGLDKPVEALRELDALKERWPDYQSQEGHLLYARLLETSGRHEEALGEYETLAGYYSGAEPRARRADLLLRLGRPEGARRDAELLLSAMRRSPSNVQRAQREWIAMAQKVFDAATR
jgi:hypothetical protein